METTRSQSTEADLTGTVAKHYNERQEVGLSERTKSRIFYLRNFNNWIKSMAINDVLMQVKVNKRGSGPITVLDLCSGKGGDLLKWKKGEIDYLVCADIAATSVEQCEARYKEMLERAKHERGLHKTFQAEFITADCSKQRLKELYKDEGIQFDLVSCQFSFHYSFESLEQAEMMLQNACECLKPGGYFVGTMPNACELVKRLRAADGMSFSNEVYEISFDTEDKQHIPLFGAKYHFKLEGVVDCPEFVVYFPLLEKMAEKYNMKLLFKAPFADYFQQKIHNSENRGLIGRMQGLEPYPPDDDVELSSSDASSYRHIKQCFDEMQERRDCDSEAGNRGRKQLKLGTLSQPEWEAATVYLVFAFQHCPDGKTTNAEVSALAADGKTSRKRTHEDCDGSHVEKERLRDDGL